MNSKDVVKTRVQTWDLMSCHKPDAATQPLLSSSQRNPTRDRPSTLKVAQQAYYSEGIGVFFRGLGICSARAFFVNAVQWAVSNHYHLLPHLQHTDEIEKVYERMMNLLAA